MPDDIWIPDHPDWGVVTDVEPHPSKDYVTPDGRRFLDSTLTITPEAAAELHQGYRCARCLEPLQTSGAFPEQCPVCGFEVAKYQRQMLEEQYRGVDPTVVGAFPLDRELAVLEQEQHKPRPAMKIPKKRRR